MGSSFGGDKEALPTYADTNDRQATGCMAHVHAKSGLTDPSVTRSGSSQVRGRGWAAEGAVTSLCPPSPVSPPCLVSAQAP